jgi:hypothetical protein
MRQVLTWSKNIVVDLSICKMHLQYMVPPQPKTQEQRDFIGTATCWWQTPYSASPADFRAARHPSATLQIWSHRLMGRTLLQTSREEPHHWPKPSRRRSRCWSGCHTRQRMVGWSARKNLTDNSREDHPSGTGMGAVSLALSPSAPHRSGRFLLWPISATKSREQAPI